MWAHRVLMPILTLLITAVIAIFGWVGNNIWSEARSWMKEFDGRVHNLEIQEAKTDGNRFTNVDWTRAKMEIDARNNEMDRRITRLEEAVPAIKETLIRIDAKLDKIQKPES